MSEGGGREASSYPEQSELPHSINSGYNLARMRFEIVLAPEAVEDLRRLKAGYRAAVYFDAVSQYALTQVPTGLTLPPTGVYLATAEHLRSNFTAHGPYLTASWLFGQGN